MNWLRLRCGQIFNYVSPNQYGGLEYLWSKLFGLPSMYDAMTGTRDTSH